MKLSIAMATYNGEKYIREQLDSILNQTRMPDEIVISDDASTDKTPKILLEYKKKYPDLIKLLLNKENVGFVKNFERAIMNTTGDLVALSDQDDMWLPEKLEKECKILEDNPQVGMVFSDLKVVDEKLNVIYDSFWENNKWRRMNGIIDGTRFFKRIIDGNRVTGCTIVVRRNMVRLILPFEKEVRYHDQCIALRISCLGGKLYALKEQLVFYRQHTSNQAGAFTKKRVNNDLSLMVEQLKEREKDLEILLNLIKKESRSIRCSNIVKRKSVWINHRKNLYLSNTFFKRVVNLFRLLPYFGTYPKKIGVLKDIAFTFFPYKVFKLEKSLTKDRDIL